MARMSYRRKRKAFVLIRLIFILTILLIGIPLLLVRCISVPRTGGDIPIINLWDVKTDTLLTMTLEEYVKGVVAAEMPIAFEPEALKAQAVVARTYALQRLENDVRIPEHPEAHLSTDFRSGQGWISFSELKERWSLLEYYLNKRKIDQVVATTKGIVATYDNKPILAVYHSTSGGRTENSEHYWTDALPYLRCVEDPYGSHSPYQHSDKKIPLEEFLTLMEINELNRVRVVDRYPSGRVKTMEAGGKWFTGRDVRQRLGLRSSWFTVEVNEQVVDFSVWGYGHGVGMSQYGADGMAKAGYDYEQILQYYYQGIQLQQIYKNP